MMDVAAWLMPVDFGCFNQVVKVNESRLPTYHKCPDGILGQVAIYSETTTSGIDHQFVSLLLQIAQSPAQSDSWWHNIINDIPLSRWVVEKRQSNSLIEFKSSGTQNFGWKRTTCD